ncbi:MAG: alpha-glucosidase [Eubacteriales bacterium]|nr:alpha-glucosidase [Eubacteriales bacterium]
MEKKWWHGKIACQIYPKSYCDSNGDGIGDLRGIISKLDYLKALGVDLIWLSPVYRSPFVDQGYDISDYYEIAPEFGTMEDFDELLREVKARGMHLIMDLVINHCSSEHRWFQAALADPEGPYGSYFYFREGKDGHAPSNHRSYFGGSAWEPVPGRENLYYYHMFAKEQPDLNWYNPKLLGELYDMINWWLEKGVSGFRIDAIINIQKNTAFPDYPADGPDGLCAPGVVVENASGIGPMLEDLKRNTFQKYDAFTVGEVFNMKEEELREFIGEDGHFSSMFDFSQHLLTSGEHGWYEERPFCFGTWRDAVFEAQRKAEPIGFLSNIIENHDEPRGASTFLPDYAQNDAGVKMLGTVSVLLRGIPFLYQGQEIGMRNCRMESVGEYDDINTKDQYELALRMGCTEQEALACCNRMSRDNARTPMQWSDAENGGFTDGTPWLKVNPDYRTINVAAQERDPDSVLHYYRRLTALRKDPRYADTFTYGRFEPAFEDADGQIMAYVRRDGRNRILVAGNWGPDRAALSPDGAVKELLLNNQAELRTDGEGRIVLESCQAVVLLLA